jgi:hypothetical protein
MIGDVTKYLRERMTAAVRGEVTGDVVRVTLTHTLDPQVYDLPLTLRTRVPDTWARARIQQGDTVATLPVVAGDGTAVVQYQARPNGPAIDIDRGP